MVSETTFFPLALNYTIFSCYRQEFKNYSYLLNARLIECKTNFFVIFHVQRSNEIAMTLNDLTYASLIHNI